VSSAAGSSVGKLNLKCLTHATHAILDITGFLY
jgi:hypothetical protein